MKIILFRAVCLLFYILCLHVQIYLGEQESEWGGYFIIGGHERILRMLQTTRRNYPIAMQR